MRADVYPMTGNIKIQCSTQAELNDITDKLKALIGEENVHKHKYNR